MSLCKTAKGSIWFALAALTVALVATPATAQLDRPHPQAEVFIGYAWLHPGIDNSPHGKLNNIPKGWGASVTLNANSWAGFTFDTGAHYGNQARISSYMAGPRFTLRGEHFSLFGHGLVGLNRQALSGFPVTNGIGLGAGGGLDLRAHQRVSVRVLEATYMFAHHNLGPPRPTMNANGVRLRAGLVFNIGDSEPPIPPSAGCVAQPTQVMAGEPVQVTASARNFRQRRPLGYAWTATGGRVEGTGETVRVNTTDLAPGQYTVTARVTEDRQEASCSASFTVQEPPRNPPQISCSANPRTVRSGDASTITCQCTSPDNRPVTVQWRTSGGRISGQGQKATLDTAGAAAGPITVTATCSDDRNLTATGTATVNVEVPPPPPQASRLAEINFARNNARVDNEAKAVLDDVALRLQRNADATAVVIGNFEADERNGQQLAAQRARNTKAYLTTERGIDPNRIQVRTGAAGTRTVVIYFVPAGATFDGAGTQVVN